MTNMLQMIRRILPKSTQLLSILLLIHAVIPFSGQASEITKRLNEIVQSLTQAYKVKRPTVQKESLTIFNLNSSEKLTREKVGFAMAELLTQRFVKDDTFVVVERTELHRVMEEQKFQQTGAIDPDTAVQVGKIIGAHILLLGSVEKLGGKYLIHTRLVEVRNGEVIAAAFEDLPAKLFEEEAKPYLVLVPEEQAIGLYLAFGFGKGSFQNFTPRILPGPSTFVTLGDNAPHFVTAGIGVRYFPKRWFLVDLAWLPAALKWDISSDFTSGATEAKNTHFMTGESFTLSANLVQPLATSLRAFAGLGGALYSVGFENGTQSGLGASDRELSTKQGGRGAKFSTLRPFLRLGTEWKLQSRIGWAVFGDLFPFQSKRTIYVHDPAPGSSTEGLSEPVLEMKFPTVIFNTTLSLYF